MGVSDHCIDLGALFPGLSAHLIECREGSRLDALVVIKIDASVGNEILIPCWSSPGLSQCINCTKFYIGPLYSVSSGCYIGTTF